MVAVDIVGRILQRAQLSRWLAAAINGQPVVVVLDGPPASARSTLVDWLVAEATEHGATTGSSSCRSVATSPTTFAAAIADTDEHMRVDYRNCVIIDDAHWLDDAGQHLVEHLAFRLGTAAVTGQPARVCLLLVARDEASSRLISRLVDEPITRRMTLGDARRSRSSRAGRTDSRRASPIGARIARLVELSGGNPLTLNALADSIAVGEVLPPPASTTGTIPVEVAWRARLATLSPEALRAAVRDRACRTGRAAVGGRRAVDAACGCTMPPSTSCKRWAPCNAAAEVCRSPIRCCEPRRSILRRPSSSSRWPASCSIGSTSAAARRPAGHAGAALGCCGANRGQRITADLVRRAYDEAIDHGSWSAAGDLAEQLVDTAVDLPDRAHWTHRLGNARFNELDRDEATSRLIEAAELYESCVDGCLARPQRAYPQRPSRMPAAGPANGFHPQRPPPTPGARPARRRN